MTPVAAIAAQMKRLRDSRKWTAADLAREMTAAGVKWDRYTVSNLERGRRQNVTVDELLALALVLDIKPVYLLAGLDDDEPYRVAPAGPTAPAGTVREWVSTGRYRPDRTGHEFVQIVRDPKLYRDNQPRPKRTPAEWAELAKQEAKQTFDAGAER